jgi:single-strand DNA-binding protein
LSEPLSPELLEQLGMEPHCTCHPEARPGQPHPEAGAIERRAGVRSQYLHDTASIKENPIRDIATATLSGNLTRDVERRSLPSGADVARLRVATTTRRRNGEEWVEKTNYFTVEVYGSRASACAQYLGKGSRVLVDAELDWREWTDPQNSRREAVTLRARQVIFEGGRPPADRGADGGERKGSSAPIADPGTPAGAAPAGEAAVRADDLPF